MGQFINRGDVLITMPLTLKRQVYALLMLPRGQRGDGRLAKKKKKKIRTSM